MGIDITIPATGQSLGETRDLIRQNFIDINTDFKVNHGEYNTANAGKHTFLQMPEQGAAPATAVNEGGVYAKETGSTSCLFYRQENSGSELQLTTSETGNTPTFGTNTNYGNPDPDTGGWTFLPGGLILMYGSYIITASSNLVEIDFPLAFPSSNAPFSISVTLERASVLTSTSTISIAADPNVNAPTSPSSTSFKVRAGNVTGDIRFNWIAIGK